MNNSVSIWPTIWKFGLITAAFRIVYSLLLYVTGLVGVTGTGFVAIAAAIVLLVVALKSYRGQNGGYASFGQAFGISFFVAAIATVARAVVDSIYLATAGREVLAALHDQTIDQLAASPSMNPQALEMMTGLMDALFTPGGMLITALFAGIIGWVVVALIVAAIMKRPAPAAAHQ